MTLRRDILGLLGLALFPMTAVGVLVLLTFADPDWKLILVGLVLAFAFAIGITAWRLAQRLILEPIEASRADAEDQNRSAHDHKLRVTSEANHRVMNSLQTVSAMFKLQSLRLPDTASRTQFDDAVARIDAIALAYRRIQNADIGDRIDFDMLLEDICNALASPDAILVKADPMQLTLDEALPLTLIVNELVSTALKGASAEEAQMLVTLDSCTDGTRFVLHKRGVSLGKLDGFGMQIIDAMVRQLRGHLDAASGADGTKFSVTFRSSLQPVPLAS